MDTKNTLTTTETEAENRLRRIRYLGQVLIVPEGTEVPTNDADEWGDQDHEIIVIR